MDKNSVRILEGIGYVSAILIGAGSLLKRPVDMLEALPWIGVMLFGIVLVRLAAVGAQDKVAASPQPAAPSPSEEEKTE
jgi:hypothetical protein